MRACGTFCHQFSNRRPFYCAVSSFNRVRVKILVAENRYYPKIKEISPERYNVSENDYESEGEIQALGIFDSIRLAVKKAENHIQEIEHGVEYGIRFSLLGEEKQQEEKEEIHKNFDTWNKVKKRTNGERPRFYTVREIWWCRLGVNVGTEQDGKGDWFVRPCVILRGFGPDACLVVPLTTSSRRHSLRIPVGLIEELGACANLSQIRVLDTRRLEAKMGFLNKEIFLILRKAARKLF